MNTHIDLFTGFYVIIEKYHMLPNLDCRCLLWHCVCTNWQIHLWFDLVFTVTGSRCKKLILDQQGSTCLNCHTQTLTILLAQTYYWLVNPHRTPKTRSVWVYDLLCGSKSRTLQKHWVSLAFSSQLSLTCHGMLVVISSTKTGRFP